jgi:hypothetical protein
MTTEEEKIKAWKGHVCRQSIGVRSPFSNTSIKVPLPQTMSLVLQERERYSFQSMCKLQRGQIQLLFLTIKLKFIHHRLYIV